MDTRLPDDPKAQWPVPVVARLIQHKLEALDIDTLVTFDRGGVSSHPNHSAAFYAVAYMFVEKNMPSSKYLIPVSLNFNLFAIIFLVFCFCQTRLCYLHLQLT